jgi:hypothetical protein
MNVDFSEHTRRVFDLEFDESIQLFVRRFQSDEPSNPWATLFCLIEAAGLAGHDSVLREAREMVMTLPTSAWRNQMERWVDAVLSIIDGDPAGVEQVRSLASVFEADRLRYNQVSLLVGAARAMPTDDPDRDAFVAQAERIASEAGAYGLADWVLRATD